jgi:hypothetical protein
VAGRITDQLRAAARAYGDKHPVEPNEADPRRDRHNPFAPFALVLIVGLMLGGWLVYARLRSDSKLQDCVMAGRRNCAPVDTSQMQPAR